LSVAHPVGVAYVFAALMIIVAVYSLGRLSLARFLRRRNHHDVSVAHVLMAFSMMGMLIPRWNVIGAGFWVPVFAVMALYFLAITAGVAWHRGPWASAGDGRHSTYHPLVHTLMATAMLDMYWLGMPVTGGAASSMVMGHTSTRAGGPGLTLLLVVLLLVAAVWLLDSLSTFTPARQLAMSAVGPGAPVSAEVAPTTGKTLPRLAPRLEISCHVAMCIAMAYMLVLMI
jgi:uncharacterized protein DUF5134